jgi:hypothetical protein
MEPRRPVGGGGWSVVPVQIVTVVHGKHLVQQVLAPRGFVDRIVNPRLARLAIAGPQSGRRDAVAVRAAIVLALREAVAVCLELVELLPTMVDDVVVLADEVRIAARPGGKSLDGEIAH